MNTVYVSQKLAEEKRHVVKERCLVTVFILVVVVVDMLLVNL